MGFLGMGMHRVRWKRDGEPEMQCGTCFEFLPIARDFWSPHHGLQKCSACLSEESMARTNRRRRSSGSIEIKRAYDADRYRRKFSTLARFKAANKEDST